MALSWQPSRYEAETPMAPSGITVLRNERRCLASKESSEEVSKTTSGEEQSWNKLGVTVCNAPETRQTALYI